LAVNRKAPWQERYEKLFFNRERGWLDGTQEFHYLCRANCSGRILEIGAGPSNPTSRYLASLGELHGIDPDSAILGNEFLVSATVLEGDRFPYADEMFDCCVSNYVCEHVANPWAHLSEIRRVLRPGGAYLFRTVNRFHYVALIASMTPHWFHKAVANRVRGLSDRAHDPYPTHYRMNSGSEITQAAHAAGMRVEHLLYIEKEPTYGRFSRIVYLLLTGYERLVNSSRLFQRVRANLFVVLRKAD
jgi:SAM-dependent methyltransferase